MRQSIVFAITALVAMASASHLLPEDATDGFYVHSYDNNGNSVYDYMGGSTPSSKRSAGPISRIHSMFRRDNPETTCLPFLISISDLTCAENGLANWFGAGQSFKGKNGASYKCGAAVAYGCDYGGGQTYTSAEFLADMYAIVSLILSSPRLLTRLNIR
jgi:hypothetical protein